MKELPDYYPLDWTSDEMTQTLNPQHPRNPSHGRSTTSKSDNFRLKIDRYSDLFKTGRKLFKLLEKLLNSRDNRISPAMDANNIFSLFSPTLKRTLQVRTYRSSPAEFRNAFL